LEPSEEQQLTRDTEFQFAANEIRPAAHDVAASRMLLEAALSHAHVLGLVALPTVELLSTAFACPRRRV
jgi:hypothetical protein